MTRFTSTAVAGRGSLSSQLHRLVYLTWFLAEGHFPPFPKYLPQWFERLAMDHGARRLEADFWAAGSDADRAEAMERLTTVVLSLAERACDGADRERPKR